MGHHQHRKENNCLNCNAVVKDRYCGVCGQENIIVKESLWGIISHFFQDITHYDGKFLSTIKYLLFRPGFLPAEYLRGRRVAYLHPIRLYVFTSAFFFLIFFTFYQKNTEIVKVNAKAYTILPKLNKYKEKLEKQLTQAKDKEDSTDILEDIDLVKKDIDLLNKDSTAVNNLQSVGYGYNFISLSDNENRKHYKTLAQYDSFQNTLPKSAKDNFVKARIERQNLYLKEKYHNNNLSAFKAIQNDFMHRIPQMLFVGLPLFALILKLLYVRRKKYFYVSHVFFTIYLLCSYFLLILFSLWLGSLTDFINPNIKPFINTLFSLLGFFYLYKAMRYFYEQRRAKTIIKYFVLLFLSMILMMLLFITFLIFSTITLK